MERSFVVFFCLVVGLLALVQEAQSAKNPFSTVHLDAFLRGGDDAQSEKSSNKKKGDKWAVLVAGSNNWWNYRHQVCASLIYLFITKRNERSSLLLHPLQLTLLPLVS